MSDTYAWTYNAGNGVYYWTESFTMSATQFAREVSSKVDKSLSSSDVSAETKSGMDAVERRARQLIYIP